MRRQKRTWPTDMAEWTGIGITTCLRKAPAEVDEVSQRPRKASRMTMTINI